MANEEADNAVARVRAGGVEFPGLRLAEVFAGATVDTTAPKQAEKKQKGGKGRDKNSGKTTSSTHKTQEHTIMQTQEQNKNNAAVNSNNVAAVDTSGMSALERMCSAVLGRLDAGGSVARVDAVRPLSEKLVDSGIHFGVMVAAGTAVAAIARFGFGIGKPSGPVDGGPMT